MAVLRRDELLAQRAEFSVAPSDTPALRSPSRTCVDELCFGEKYTSNLTHHPCAFFRRVDGDGRAPLQRRDDALGDRPQGHDVAADGDFARRHGGHERFRAVAATTSRSASADLNAMRTASAGAAVASVAFSRRSFAPSDQQRSVPCDVDAHTSVGSAVPTSFPSWARARLGLGETPPQAPCLLSEWV